MKRSLTFLIITLIATTTAFLACTKESSDDGSILVIDAKNILNSNNCIDYVEAIIFKTKSSFITIAKSDYLNDSFALTLPQTVSKEYLDENENGSLGLVEIVAYSADSIVGALFLGDTAKKVQVHYIFADKNFNVRGAFKFEDIEYATQVWNCSFVKGWNTLYAEVMSNNTLSFTTQQPLGVNLQWYFSVYQRIKNHGKFLTFAD